MSRPIEAYIPDPLITAAIGYIRGLPRDRESEAVYHVRILAYLVHMDMGAQAIPADSDETADWIFAKLEEE